MPELIEDPVTLASLPAIAEALLGLRIVSVDTGDAEGTVTIQQILSLIGAGNIPDGSISSAKLASGAVVNNKIPDAEIGLAKLSLSALAELKWLGKAVGEFYVADDGVAGVDIPPIGIAGLTAWVELTAGLTGGGGFNNAKLASESVTGSAPLVLATAVVSLSGSPMNGQTIRLLNTERRMLRAGASGTLQADAMENVTGTISGTQEALAGTGPFSPGVAGPANRPNNGSANTQALNFDLSLVARTATETRMKNIGVRIFRRIK